MHARFSSLEVFAIGLGLVTAIGFGFVNMLTRATGAGSTVAFFALALLGVAGLVMGGGWALSVVRRLTAPESPKRA